MLFEIFVIKWQHLPTKTVQEDPENFLERGRLFVESDLLPQIRALNSETKAITEKKNCVCTGARILCSQCLLRSMPWVRYTHMANFIRCSRFLT